MVNRRDLLTGGALLAAGLTMAACTPGATTIRPQPSGRPTMPTDAPRTLVAFFSRAGENPVVIGRGPQFANETWRLLSRTSISAYSFRRRVRAATDVPAASPPTTVSFTGRVPMPPWGHQADAAPCRHLFVPACHAHAGL